MSNALAWRRGEVNLYAPPVADLAIVESVPIRQGMNKLLLGFFGLLGVGFIMLSVWCLIGYVRFGAVVLLRAGLAALVPTAICGGGSAFLFKVLRASQTPSLRFSRDDLMLTLRVHKRRTLVSSPATIRIPWPELLDVHIKRRRFRFASELELVVRGEGPKPTVLRLPGEYFSVPLARVRAVVLAYAGDPVARSVLPCSGDVSS